jgi:hypothetical protein
MIVFFASSKADQDAPMRRGAPLLYAAGLLMVVTQLCVAFGAGIGGVSPPCVMTNKCQSGAFCYKFVGQDTGRCLLCGEEAPLPRYDDPETGKQWNKAKSGSFPAQFAGFNLTMVDELCTHPRAVKHDED